MNIIEVKKNKPIETRADYIFTRHETDQTAFIGQCGNGPKGSLYLITFNNIVLASNPAKTWGGHTAVIIERYVDIEIAIVEKTN